MSVEVSICGAGKKCFWCVCDEADDRPLACGHAATLEDAEEQVWVQATIHRKGVRAEWVGDGLARRVRRCGSGTIRGRPGTCFIPIGRATSRPSVDRRPIRW